MSYLSLLLASQSPGVAKSSAAVSVREENESFSAPAWPERGK